MYEEPRIIMTYRLFSGKLEDILLSSKDMKESWDCAHDGWKLDIVHTVFLNETERMPV